MQPRMERRVRFSHRHEEPDRQRQNRRRRVKTLAGAAIYLSGSRSHSGRKLATITPKPRVSTVVSGCEGLLAVFINANQLHL